ncbi:hypothetical protein ACFS27_03320 [Promicromonospora vindobonensis]|uniref:Uncharacterized protein n=1 Tax=Promicromonospora vindobonensis TaxID=195748 RepID=A0ABW5VMM8_9MICO
MNAQTDTTSEVARVLEFGRVWAEATVAYHRAVEEAFRPLLEMAGADESEDAQIAAPVPAGEARADSAGRGASGGLGERLRALVAGPHPDVLLVLTAQAEYIGIVEQVEQMEDDLRFTAARANSSEASYQQLMLERERVRAQLAPMTKSSDEKTVRHGTALLHILDGRETNDDKENP